MKSTVMGNCFRGSPNGQGKYALDSVDLGLDAVEFLVDLAPSVGN